MMTALMSLLPVPSPLVEGVRDMQGMMLTLPTLLTMLTILPALTILPLLPTLPVLSLLLRGVRDTPGMMSTLPTLLTMITILPALTILPILPALTILPPNHPTNPTRPNHPNYPTRLTLPTRSEPPPKRGKRHAGNRFTSGEEDSSEEETMGTLFGLFQLSDRVICSSGSTPSLNLCQMNCSALIDDNISDDLNCVATIKQTIGRGQQTMALKKMIDLLFQKECLATVAPSYFSKC
ncbi:uncharacterized protein LOC115181895 isoform X2 [Salmo trutta]|uniref:uncharacterized protein LOC115181895 isoform X2 n=1 Tax=Salmo trutta TaxID=8032 RepID=UPI0011325F36|nr:uncharacterized protein LOC115181895 isoform X2 [Salmo trutta]